MLFFSYYSSLGMKMGCELKKNRQIKTSLDKHKKKSFPLLNNGMFLLVLIQNEQFLFIMQYNLTTNP